MKIDYFFKSILTSFILLAALSCDKSDEVEDKTETKTRFDVSVSGDLNESLEADIKANNYDGIYVVGMVSEEIYQSEMSSSAEDYAYYLLDFIQASGSALDKADNEYTFKGDSKVNLKSTWEPTYATKYYIAVFGVDEQGVVSTDIVMKEYTTQAAPVSPFSISLSGAELGAVTLEVTVSDDYKGNYIAGPVTKEFFEKSLDSKESLLSGIIMSYVSEKTEGSYDLSTGYAYNGSQTIDIYKLWDLEPNTEYIIAVFGLKEYDDGTGLGAITVADDLTTQTVEFTTSYTTTPIAGSVEVSVTDTVDAAGFSVQATKSEEVGYYYVAVMSDNDFGAQYGSDAQSAAARYLEDTYADVEIGDFSNLIGTAPIFSESGVIDLRNYYPYGFKPETSYTVLAFGIDEELNVTSAVGECHQTTAKVQLLDTTFDIKVVGEATANDFTVSVSPSDKDINYLVCAYEAKAFDPLDGWFLNFDTLAPDYAQAAQQWIYDLSDWYEPVGEGQEPVKTDMTTANGVTIFRGDAEAVDVAYARTTDLKASTDYVVLVFGISASSNIITEVATLEVKTADPEQSDSSFTFEVIDEMAYSDAMGAYGKVKIIPSDPTLKYFASIAVATNVDGLSDQEIFDANRFSMIAPYTSFTGEYDYEYFYVYEDSYIVVCGYDGGMTTPMSKFKITVE